MKDSILQAIAMFLSSATETVLYKSWSNDFARGAIHEAYKSLKETVSKNLDWDHINEYEARQLGFVRYASDESIDKDIELYKRMYDVGKISKEVMKDESAKLLATKGLWLIPIWLVETVPAGTKLTSITGEVFKCGDKKLSLDTRFGCVAYGIRIK